jgi:hypothetical protein
MRWTYPEHKHWKLRLAAAAAGMALLAWSFLGGGAWPFYVAVALSFATSLPYVRADLRLDRERKERRRREASTS